MRYIYLGQPEKSAMVEHRFETGHSINFSRTCMLDNATGCVHHVIQEACEIRL
jgi:hypothetical protein